MRIKDVLKWNTRVSAVYALGVWAMIGTYAYLRYTGRNQDASVKKEEAEQLEDPNQVVYETAHTKTVIVYKKDFVPYTTRIYNLITSFSGDRGAGDGDK